MILLNTIEKKMKKEVDIKKAIAWITSCFVICAFCIAVSIMILARKTAFAYSQDIEEDIESELTPSVQNNLNIDILGIIEENTKDKYKEEYESEEIDLEYITIYEESEELPKGMIQVLQEGRDGKQLLTTKKVYLGEELVSEEELPYKITKPCINKIVKVGTSQYTSNYTVKEGDTLYVTPDTLAIFPEPNKDMEKISTVYQDTAVTVLEIHKEWYKIKTQTSGGYVPSNCLTYLKPKSLLTANMGDKLEYSRVELLSRLSFNMPIDTPSGLTLEQFQRILSGNSQDRNKIFENNAQYFYYIEEQYNINGVFVAALGIHESGWGSSSITLNKRNLFGYGASDSNPYGNAYNYRDYSESIDQIARVLVKYYLNPSGTSIYDGQVASGAYYNGATISGVNTKYATDKNWSNAVYNWMKLLYERL